MKREGRAYRTRLWRLGAALAGAAGLLYLPAKDRARAADPAPTYVEIAPILNERCVLCHTGEDAPLGLRLDSLEGLTAGSENGPVVRSGQAGDSELVRRIKCLSEPRMPLTGPPFLDEREIALIEAWIAGGMPAGDAGAAEVAPAPRRVPRPGEPVVYADVAPIFLKRCVKCHTDDGLRGAPPEGLRLKTRALILTGGERMVVVPGNPGASALVRHIRGQSRPRMPFDGPPFLNAQQIRLIADWIAQGAPDDQGNAAPIPVGARLRLEGTLTGRWRLDGTPLVVTGRTRIDKNPRVGDHVQVRGTVGPDGSIRVNRLRRR